MIAQIAPTQAAKSAWYLPTFITDQRGKKCTERNMYMIECPKLLTQNYKKKIK